MSTTYWVDVTKNEITYDDMSMGRKLDYIHGLYNEGAIQNGGAFYANILNAHGDVIGIYNVTGSG